MLDYYAGPDDFEVPHNFTIPDNYRRRHILHIPDRKLTEILIGDGKMILRDHAECLDPEAGSWALDWIQETVEAIRCELEST